MATCTRCGAEFEPPDEPARPGDYRFALCPDHLAVFYAEKGQEEAAARAVARETCEAEGHVPYAGCADNNCARCGEPVPRTPPTQPKKEWAISTRSAT